MLSWLGNLIGGPLVRAALDAYRLKLESKLRPDQIAAELSAKELELQLREMELRNQRWANELGRWWEPDKLMGYCVAIYFAKVVVWDKVLRWGTTDELHGWAGVTATSIVIAYFGKRGIENIFKIVRRGK